MNVTYIEFVTAAARTINLTPDRIPPMDTDFIETVELPEGFKATFKPSKLDIARWKLLAKGCDSLFLRPCGEGHITSDSMGRKVYLAHGFGMEISKRGVGVFLLS